MYKQKQIEEMAKDMLEYGMATYPTADSVFTETKLREQFYHVFLTYAEYLINKGYCKILENAVVLTKEEYKLLDEKIKALEGYVDALKENKRVSDELIKVLEMKVKLACKGTVEKIMNNISGDVLVVDTKEYGRIEVVPLERLDEICEKFTEGVQ